MRFLCSDLNLCYLGIMKKISLTPLQSLWLAGVILNLTCWLLLLFLVPADNFPFIIKYTVGSSADFWGTRLNLFLVPSLGLIILVLNVILSRVFKEREENLAWLISGIAVFCQVLVLLYALATIYVNTY